MYRKMYLKQFSIVCLLDLVNVASAGKVGSNLSIPTVQERKGFRRHPLALSSREIEIKRVLFFVNHSSLLPVLDLQQSYSVGRSSDIGHLSVI